MTFDFKEASAWIQNHLFLFDEDEIQFLDYLIEWARKEYDEEIPAGTRVETFRYTVMRFCRGKEGWPYVRGEEE